MGKHRINRKKMPKGGGRSRARSNSRSTTKTYAQIQAEEFNNKMPDFSSYSRKTQAPAQAPAKQGGGMMSGLMGTMMQGMAFGAGSEIAHTAMRSVMGGSGTQEQQQQPEQTQQTQQNTNQCQNENSNFVECLKFNSNDIQGCQNYLDLLKTCETRFN